MTDLLSLVGEALVSVIGWVGKVVTALVSDTGDLHALLPLLAVGIAVTALRFAVGSIRSFIWGA